MLCHLKKYILLYTLAPLLVLTVGASYVRFMVQYDYLVTYEGECDPYTQICFEYCEDEKCDEPIHYTWIERDAAILKQICGDHSILDCEAAMSCLPDENRCSISFCDSTIDEDCEQLSSQDETPKTDTL